MLFPNPLSSRVLVRKTLAAVVGEVGNIFAGEVEAFLAEEARARRGDYGSERIQCVGEKDEDGKMSLKEWRVRKIAKKVFAVSVCVTFFISFELRAHLNLVIDKVEVHLSVSNHCQVRTSVLVRIPVLSTCLKVGD